MDGAGKWRYIAIGPWVLQRILKPLHNLVFRWLRDNICDATFKQEKIFQIAGVWSTRGNPDGTYSLDLSKATDRLPLTLQILVLSQALGNLRLALIWGLLMSCCTFGVTGTPFTVRYGTGQGMGLYSSWALLRLTHHVIIRDSFRKVGIPYISQGGVPRYLVLGDDIVIFNKEARDRYQETMSFLGVDITLRKSVISPPGTTLCCEFAAKLVRGGLDVGPLPLGALFSGTSFDLFTLWDSLGGRVPSLVPATIREDPAIQRLVHAPDFGPSFPLARSLQNGLRVYDELATLWGVAKFRKGLEATRQMVRS